MQPPRPLFSIVVPAYNREVEIRRALTSCLCQDDPAFEIVVVDDGSTDGTASAVASFKDGRIRLVQQPNNLGHGPARNLGSSQAKGDWIVILDSDDELLHGALSHMRRLIEHGAPHIDRYAFRYKRDDGRIFPFPPVPEKVLDYEGYLAWLNRAQLWDFLSCTRRRTFDTVRWPASRWAGHMLYYLDFAQRFQTSFRPDVLALVHTDSGDRLTYRRRNPREARESAEALRQEMALLLDRHGQSLKVHAPAKYQMFRRTRISCCFLSGMRAQALAEWWSCLRATPLMPELWMLLVLGMLGPGLFAKARSTRRPAT